MDERRHCYLIHADFSIVYRLVYRGKRLTKTEEQIISPPLQLCCGSEYKLGSSWQDCDFLSCQWGMMNFGLIILCYVITYNFVFFIGICFFPVLIFQDEKCKFCFNCKNSLVHLHQYYPLRQVWNDSTSIGITLIFTGYQ